MEGKCGKNARDFRHFGHQAIKIHIVDDVFKKMKKNQRYSKGKTLRKSLDQLINRNSAKLRNEKKKVHFGQRVFWYLSRYILIVTPP